MRTNVHKGQTVEILVEHPFFLELPMEKEHQLQLEKAAVQLASRMEVEHPPSMPQIPPIKKEFQTQQSEQLRKEVQLPAKEEVQVPLKNEKHLLHEREDLLSPLMKKPKISMDDHYDDGDGVYSAESPKGPIRGVPCEVPKRCIEHCQLFLPDCEFERDMLARMWIAEGCIEQVVTKRMEDVGYSYFDALVQEEVIVPAKFDKVHRQMRYKFNTSQVGLLKQVKYLWIKASNMDEISKEILHLTLQCERLDQIPFDYLKNLKELHTFVVHEHGFPSISELPSSIFLNLRLLKTLDLSCTHIHEIPWSIGKLELLKYLDVSETPLKRLPESLDRLCYLQTLNLRDCVGVTALPRDFGMLVNLRHLDLNIVRQLESMPRGMGNLVELQTLPAFIVGRDDGCGIGELKNMNEITGSFCISLLENVTNAKEAREAALYNKKHIDKLELRWRTCGDENFEDAAEILEALQPQFGVKELQLTYYRGSRLPTWISDPSYSELSTLTLYKCINCDMLPSIGELPSLKILSVFKMDNVRNINTIFCRNHEDKVFNAFPRLENLTLDSMPALEEWTGVEDGDFPRLCHVAIAYCPKLRALLPLSQLCSLEHIEIINCMQLVSLPEGSLPPSIGTLIIEACPKLSEKCR